MMQSLQPYWAWTCQPAARLSDASLHELLLCPCHLRDVIHYNFASGFATPARHIAAQIVSTSCKSSFPPVARLGEGA